MPTSRFQRMKLSKLVKVLNSKIKAWNLFYFRILTRTYIHSVDSFDEFFYDTVLFQKKAELISRKREMIRQEF